MHIAFAFLSLIPRLTAQRHNIGYIVSSKVRLLGRSLTMSTSTSTNISKYSKACASVYLVPMFSDNYGLLLVDENDNCSGGKRTATCVDPGDGAAILRAVDELNLDLKYVLCTHKHSDHVGGNSLIRQHIPSVQIIGTAYEEIPEVNLKVADGDTFSLGDLQVQTIYTPCHTKGHVLYFVQRKVAMQVVVSDASWSESSSSSSVRDLQTPILFTGDTLFVGGCGRFFEGTATDMLTNMDRIATLPAHTVVFCAHEYTESNLRFLASVDEGSACMDMLREVQMKRGLGIPTVPTTIGRELEYNLFMKCRESRTQELLKCRNAEETMGTLRKKKNDFK